MKTITMAAGQIPARAGQHVSSRYSDYGWSSFSILVFISGALSAINFFITPNPYTAAHSGSITPVGVFISVSMLIHPMLIAMGSLAITYFKLSGFTFRINAATAAWSFLALLSGFVNGVLWGRPLTYIFDVSSFILMGSLVLAERSRNLDESMELVLRFIVAATLIGMVLSILRPGVWGAFQIGFSREARGENVFGNLLGAALLPALAIGLKNLPIRYRAFAYCVGLASQISSGSRTYTFLALVPLVIYVIFRRRGIARIATLAGVLLLLVVVLAGNIDKFIFSDGGKISLEATLTGRYDLWTYYWQKFLSAPVFGHGVFLLDRVKDYYGYATSEIGLLKVAAEYGALAALVKFSVVMTATVAAISAVLRADTRPYQLVLALYLLPAVPNFILQSQTRFGGVGDYFFWYSVFYYCFRAIPQLRRHLKI